MIKVYKQTPEYYYNNSRDFQLIGRIFEAVFNYVKMGSDNVINTPLRKNIDTALTDLVTLTIGFESRNKYDVQNLVSLAHSFHTVLRKKGTKEAIEDSIKVLLKAQNIQEKAEVVVDNKTYIDNSNNKYQERMISIYVPQRLTDIALLEDMLNYILPVGFNYEIIPTAYQGQEYKNTAGVSNILKQTDKLEDEKLGTVTKGQVTVEKDETQNTEIGVVDSMVVIKGDV